MNIGTAADGGNAVPTGHYQKIVAKRDEFMLAPRLGVRNIPGKGLTVNVPLDNEADGEFIATNEAAGNDRDAPALATTAMTLVKYTKRVELSNELMNDEDSQLMAFLSDFVGRGMAKTHNALLNTVVAAGGTNLKTLAGDDVIAAGEPQDMVFNNDLANYLDDTNSVGWVMRASTHGMIAKLQGDPFIYQMTPQGSNGNGVPSRGTLLGYPVHYSAAVPAPAASAKSILFGNFNYVGVRNDPEFVVLRDPFSAASTGQLRLHYYFRTVYKVLQAEAVGFATQAAS
jgi:HK97 family phage major capsid protein